MYYHNIFKNLETFLQASFPTLFSSPLEILPQKYVKALSDRSLRLTVHLYLRQSLEIRKAWKPHLFMKCCFNISLDFTTLIKLNTFILT